MNSTRFFNYKGQATVNVDVNGTSIYANIIDTRDGFIAEDATICINESTNLAPTQEEIDEIVAAAVDAMTPAQAREAFED